MQLNRLRIGTRLALGFGSLMAFLIVVSALAILQFKHVKSDFTDVAEMEKRSAAADDWRRLTELNMNRAFAIVKSGGHATVESHFGPEVKKTSAQINDIQKFLEAAVESEKGKEALGRIAATRKVYVAARDEVFKLVKAGDVAKTEVMIVEKMMPAAGLYLAELEAFHKIQTGLLSERGDVVTKSASTAMMLVGALAAGGIGLGVLFAWLITRSVTMPLNQAVKATRAVAAGDLSQRFEVQGSDEAAELLTSLDDMQQSLKKLIGDVRSSTESISTASGEIATGNQDLSQRTEQTASSLQQTASSMEQLTGTVKQTADSARTANQLANSAQATAAKGGEVVSQVVSTMEEINASSKKISDIIGVIDGIAFQTNILALNAAVEAARAGEQGRGFAVVASEVRSLAQRSANAAKEIKGLIGASVEKVESGTRLVADAGQTMSEIVGSVQRVSDIINEITAAASEQSDGIGQVNQAVTTLDQMTQQNAALVEQSAAAAESLKDQAIRLSSSVSLFKLSANDAPRATIDAAPKALPAPVSSFAAKKPAVSARPAAQAPSASKPSPIKPAAPRVTTTAAAPASAPATAAAGSDWETF